VRKDKTATDLKTASNIYVAAAQQNNKRPKYLRAQLRLLEEQKETGALSSGD
jgi:hypothetical protein